jgi:uncharacterized protein (DUF433 family)
LINRRWDKPVFQRDVEEEGNRMATLDCSQCAAVKSVPGKRSGAWIFLDMRTPVSVVFDNLEVGATIDEIMEWFHLSHEQVVAVIEFAAQRLGTIPPGQPLVLAVDAHTF